MHAQEKGREYASIRRLGQRFERRARIARVCCQHHAYGRKKGCVLAQPFWVVMFMKPEWACYCPSASRPASISAGVGGMDLVAGAAVLAGGVGITGFNFAGGQPCGNARAEGAAGVASGAAATCATNVGSVAAVV